MQRQKQHNIILLKLEWRTFCHVRAVVRQLSDLRSSLRSLSRVNPLDRGDSIHLDPLRHWCAHPPRQGQACLSNQRPPWRQAPPTVNLPKLETFDSESDSSDQGLLTRAGMDPWTSGGAASREMPVSARVTCQQRATSSNEVQQQSFRLLSFRLVILLLEVAWADRYTSTRKDDREIAWNTGHQTFPAFAYVSCFL